MISPMMQHYLNTKEEYKDCILFYRLGDFYEMFFDDALLVSKELELTLTGKDCGMDERAPMCGVPYHSAEGYIAKLIKNGHKVAICEQIEDPKQTKGIVKRQVIKVVTPGTVSDPEALSESRNNFLMSICKNKTKYGIAYIDYSTGEFFATEIEKEDTLIDEIKRLSPAEIVANEEFLTQGPDIRDVSVRLSIAVSQIEEDDLSGELSDESRSVLSGLKGAMQAAGAIISYIKSTQMNFAYTIGPVKRYFAEKYMVLDDTARKNLELTETMRDKQKRGSLLFILDKTKTAMGKRRIRQFLECPLGCINDINDRLDAVESMFKSPMEREEIRSYLNFVADIERLLGKICTSTANPRDLISLKNSLKVLPELKKILGGFEGKVLGRLFEEIDSCMDITSLIENSIEDDPPVSLKDGGVIKTGFSYEIDELKRARDEGTSWLADLEGRERENTGIKNLKVKYNKVFGYYLEVTNSFKEMVPDGWVRKQTLVGAERYINAELKELEDKILGAHEKLVVLEHDAFARLRDHISNNAERLRKVARAVANVDCICALARVAEQNGYVRPHINTSGIIDIKNGRHPVIEKMLPENTFVANDTFLNSENETIALITGPNMAGKSTYMRQTALIVLMAHMGSFVPATRADIALTDRIFTRVGASDDLSQGQSTFMVEMAEVANILKNATDKSLLILDEIGRGTGTLDGLSIAQAVIEFVADKAKCGAKTLFATHFHELTGLQERIFSLKNLRIEVKEKGDDVIFLRRIVKGGADKSYGIHVASLAGIPGDVTKRAGELLKLYSEGNDIKTGKKEEAPLFEEPVLMSKVAENEKEYDKDYEEYRAICDQLREFDINAMTPVEALNKLADLKSML